MGTELRLTLKFEGTDAGLERDRLRIDAFAPALIEFQRAYRRIAQGLIRNATKGDVGRFSIFVEDLAWEIDTVSHHSPVEVVLACPLPATAPGDTMAMFAADTVDRAADEILTAIEMETKGVRRNAAVRSYLEALPPGIYRQTYSLTTIQGKERTIEFGHMDRLVLDVDYPAFVRRTAQIVGAHFPPAAPEVRFLAEPFPIFTAASTPEDVDAAIEHRSQLVNALFVRKGKRMRALWFNPGRDPLRPPSREARNEYYARRWKKTLMALAD